MFIYFNYEDEKTFKWLDVNDQTLNRHKTNVELMSIESLIVEI